MQVERCVFMFALMYNDDEDVYIYIAHRHNVPKKQRDFIMAFALFLSRCNSKG